MTKEQLQKEYSQACVKVGDIRAKIMFLEAQEQEFLQVIKDLNQKLQVVLATEKSQEVKDGKELA